MPAHLFITQNSHHKKQREEHMNEHVDSQVSGVAKSGINAWPRLRADGEYAKKL